MAEGDADGGEEDVGGSVSPRVVHAVVLRGQRAGGGGRGERRREQERQSRGVAGDGAATPGVFSLGRAEGRVDDVAQGGVVQAVQSIKVKHTRSFPPSPSALRRFTVV